MRILQSGFELNNLSTEFPTTLLDGSAIFEISNEVPRTGTYHLKVENISGANKTYGVKGFPYAVSELFIRIPINIFTFTIGTAQNELFSLWDGANEHIMVCLNTARQIEIRRSGTLLVTDPTVLSTGLYYLLEFHFSIANSSGIIQMKVNGVTTTDTTGDTQNSGNASVNTIRIGETETVSTTSGKNTYEIYWDDLVINDTSGTKNNSWVGDGGIILLTPNSAGSSTQLSRGGTDSGANWSQVDEIPPNGTVDYVFSSAAGSADLYNLSSVPGTFNTASLVNAIRWIGYVAQDLAGAGSVARYIRTDSTNYEGSVFGLPVGTVFTEVSELMGTNPATGNSWTITELNSLEAGVMTR